MAKAVESKVDRREHISKALYQCMKDKGYAHTRLRDIAKKANMSPSHLGYYFDNKAAILEHYAVATCQQTIDDFPNLEQGGAADLIKALADFCLGSGQMSVGLLSAIQEITGLAVHDNNLFKIKSEHSSYWHKYLVRFFEKINFRSGLSAQSAAWQLHATIIGINTNLIFDKSLNRKSARELLRAQILFLAGETTRK